VKILAAVDIGNSTTEVCLAIENEAEIIRFLSSSSTTTTGLKGTISNVTGILTALEEATKNAGINIQQISHIRINKAAPVIGGAAMETLAQTVVTEASMLGHNPKTPAGIGIGFGKTIKLKNLDTANLEEPFIVIISNEINYEDAATKINHAFNKGVIITGAIMQQDEAVLVYNRLSKKIPIIDEVKDIHKIHENIVTAIETALPGQTVSMLSNPYGIATLFDLTPKETIQVTPIANSLIGVKSATVMKTPWNDPITIQTIGKIYIKGDKDIEVDFSQGAHVVAQAVETAGQIYDITGEPGTNIGNMLVNATNNMIALAEGENVKIRDLFTVDTFAPVLISGALSGETRMEKAIAVAVMVTAGRLPMEAIANDLAKKTGIYTTVAGVEPVMAALGTLTTPGAGFPLAMLDIGGGSTDAAVIQENGIVKSVSLAGAGELVSVMIQSQLGLSSRHTAENIKKYPVAKVESMFHIRLENGEIIFYEDGIDPKIFGAVVILTPEGMIKIEEDRPIEKIVKVRQETKRAVFINNSMRAIKKLELLNIKHVILVGGSAKDFEIPAFLSTAFAEMGIVCGQGNIRSTEGPRNAVATGLIMGYVGEQTNEI